MGTLDDPRFRALVESYADDPSVSLPGEGQGFGGRALRVGGRIFAMFARGELVVKLPAARVDELVAAGEGIRFDANKGTPMREWFCLDAGSPLDWHALAAEAYRFVGS